MKGVEHIYRESLETSVKMGVDILQQLGFRKYTAYRAAQNFIKYDEAAMRKLTTDRHDKKLYISRVREEIELQETLLREDITARPCKLDHVWDSEEMRGKIGNLRG